MHAAGEFFDCFFIIASLKHGFTENRERADWCLKFMRNVCYKITTDSIEAAKLRTQRARRDYERLVDLQQRGVVTAKDFEGAAKSRDEEKKLLGERLRLEKEWRKGECELIPGVTAPQIAALRANAWSYWLASQIRALSPSQLQAVDNTQLSGWGNTQLQALDSTQWQALSLQQRQSLTATQISAFSPSQVATWSNSTLSELTNTQLTGLSTAQITPLTTTQVNAFTASQWPAWSRSQIAALTKTQIAALTPSHLSLWSTAQLAALNAAQVAALSFDQLNALSSTQKSQLAATGQLQQWLGTEVARVQANATATSANRALAVTTTATT